MKEQAKKKKNSSDRIKTNLKPYETKIVIKTNIRTQSKSGKKKAQTQQKIQKTCHETKTC